MPFHCCTRPKALALHPLREKLHCSCLVIDITSTWLLIPLANTTTERTQTCVSGNASLIDGRLASVERKRNSIRDDDGDVGHIRSVSELSREALLAHHLHNSAITISVGPWSAAGVSRRECCPAIMFVLKHKDPIAQRRLGFRETNLSENTGFRAVLSMTDGMHATVDQWDHVNALS